MRNHAGARANKLMPEEFTGGCTSVSNLGMFDISEFIAGERRGLFVRAELERERRQSVREMIVRDSNARTRGGGGRLDQMCWCVREWVGREGRGRWGGEREGGMAGGREG